jgi:hypothetical protein
VRDACLPRIATFDLPCRPGAALAPHGIRAQHCDEFVGGQLRGSPEAFPEATRTPRASLQHPPKSVEEHLSTRSASGLPRTAAELGPHRGGVWGPLAREW